MVRKGVFSLIFVLLLVQFSWAASKGKILFQNIAPGELTKELASEWKVSYPLKIIFESESKIPYGGVYVRIFNDSGVSVFHYLCEKPLLFMKLSKGEYYVVAVDRKKVQRIKAFRVKGEGAPQTVVTLQWPREVVGY